MDTQVKWTLDRCMQDAKLYSTRHKWQLGSRGAYHAAHRHGWLDICCSHMTRCLLAPGSWNLETCKQDANRFKYRSDWSRQSSSAYHAAHRNGWLELCCEHMKAKKKNEVT